MSVRTCEQTVLNVMHAVGVYSVYRICHLRRHLCGRLLQNHVCDNTVLLWLFSPGPRFFSLGCQCHFSAEVSRTNAKNKTVNTDIGFQDDAFVVKMNGFTASTNCPVTGPGSKATYTLVFTLDRLVCLHWVSPWSTRFACSGNSARRLWVPFRIPCSSGQFHVYSASLGACLCRFLSRFCSKSVHTFARLELASVRILLTETPTVGDVVDVVSAIGPKDTFDESAQVKSLWEDDVNRGGRWSCSRSGWSASGKSGQGSGAHL